MSTPPATTTTTAKAVQAKAPPITSAAAARAAEKSDRKETKKRWDQQKTNRLKAEEAIDQQGKRVAAIYKSMRELEAQAEEKAGFELKKAAEKRAALEQSLVEAQRMCKAAGKSFKEFQEKFAPDYKRTRLYQILAIADGRTTVEGVRKNERKKKRKQRAARKSVRDKSDVPDETAEKDDFGSNDELATGEDKGRVTVEDWAEEVHRANKLEARQAAP